MTNLQGSEKQIKWAEEIRKEMLETTTNLLGGQYKEILDVMDKMQVTIEELIIKGKGSPIENDLNKVKNLLDKKVKIENEASAKWFIDNRMNFSWL